MASAAQRRRSIRVVPQRAPICLGGRCVDRTRTAWRHDAAQEIRMTKRGEREEDVWLSDEQLSKLARADEVDDLHSPVPTRMVSNGEHMPIPQTAEQKRVEHRIADLADTVGGRLGLGRRRFLAGAGGVV